jgi:CBS domain-containing protein
MGLAVLFSLFGMNDGYLVDAEFHVLFVMLSWEMINKEEVLFRCKFDGGIRLASNVLVENVMSRNYRVVRMDTSAQEVVATMNKYDVDFVIVVQSGRPVGMITARDVLVRLVEQCLAPRAVTAREILTSPLVTINRTATVEEAVQLMKRWRIKKLPVVEEDLLVGVVTDVDIAFKVPTMLSAVEELCRPTR